MSIRELQQASNATYRAARRDYLDARLSGAYKAGKVQQTTRRESTQEIRDCIRQHCSR